MSSFPNPVKAALRCRACGGADLVPYLDLGNQALANAFLKQEDLAKEEFTAPLGVQWCPRCGLSQLTHVVAPETLYTNYLYSSGVSPGWVDHETRLAEELTALRPDKQFIVEIGSNDGTFLQLCQDRGHTVLGVEPAVNLVAPEKVPTICRFWSPAVATGIAQFHEPADVVVAQNVFGHVDDALSFLAGVSTVMADEGVCIIEAPHILALLEQNAVDTIYHEHLSYWGLKPLQVVAEAAGLSVTSVQAFPQLHGGTMRYTLQKGHRVLTPSVRLLVDLEEALFAKGLEPYQRFAEDADHLVQRFYEYIQGVHAFHRRIVGYGASAKGNVLLQASSVTSLEYIADDTPAKQGLYTPGTHIPVHALEDLSGVAVLVLLAWNWKDEMKAKAKALGFKGRFLVPIPEPHYE